MATECRRPLRPRIAQRGDPSSPPPQQQRQGVTTCASYASTLVRWAIADLMDFESQIHDVSALGWDSAARQRREEEKRAIAEQRRQVQRAEQAEGTARQKQKRERRETKFPDTVGSLQESQEDQLDSGQEDQSDSTRCKIDTFRKLGTAGFSDVVRGTYRFPESHGCCHQ